MQILITEPMKQALEGIGHVPDNLAARLAAMTPADGGWALKLNEGDATELAELVQWYITTDAATGKATPETEPFVLLIGLIDAAMFS